MKANEIMTDGLLTRDKEVLGGEPVFAGTRVPVRNLFDYLENGHSLHEFLDDFPTVSRDQAQGVMSLMKKAILAAA
jgi:uncharacterized protein (DUF433 family)